MRRAAFFASFASFACAPRSCRAEAGQRIKEQDVYLPALEILSAADGGFMKTADLIKVLERHFNPEGEDAEILAGRSDTRFSHSPFEKGVVGGLKGTEQGYPPGSGVHSRPKPAKYTSDFRALVNRSGHGFPGTLPRAARMMTLSERGPSAMPAT